MTVQLVKQQLVSEALSSLAFDAGEQGDNQTERKPGPRGQPQRDSKEAVRKLLEGLKSADPEVRAKAVQAFADAEVGAAGKEAVPALVTALKDKDPKVRGWAVMAIDSIGPTAKGAVPALTEALKDKDADVRRHAA